MLVSKEGDPFAWVGHLLSLRLYRPQQATSSQRAIVAPFL